MATSALAATVVLALEELLVVSGSGVTDDTVAVLVIVPGGVEASTLATIVIAGAVAPAARVPRPQVTCWPTAVQSALAGAAETHGGTGWQLVGNRCVLGVAGGVWAVRV